MGELGESCLGCVEIVFSFPGSLSSGFSAGNGGLSAGKHMGTRCLRLQNVLEVRWDDKEPWWMVWCRSDNLKEPGETYSNNEVSAHLLHDCCAVTATLTRDTNRYATHAHTRPEQPTGKLVACTCVSTKAVSKRLQYGNHCGTTSVT